MNKKRIFLPGGLGIKLSESRWFGVASLWTTKYLSVQYIALIPKPIPFANIDNNDEFEQKSRFDWVIAELQGICETASTTFIVEGNGLHAAFVTFVHCIGEELIEDYFLNL